MKQNKIKLSERQFIQVSENFLDTQPMDLEYYMVLEQTFVHKTKGYEDCNTVYVKNHNLLIHELPRQGGTIIGSPGDVECIYFLEPYEYTNMPEEIQNLVNLILSKGYVPKIDNNDILINDYKVASWSAKNINEKVFVAVVASINVDMEKINNICLKIMGKTPKGLSEFGITTEEVKQAFELE